MNPYFARSDEDRELINMVRALDSDKQARVAELVRLLVEKPENIKPALQRFVTRINANDAEALSLGTRYLAGEASILHLLEAARWLDLH